LPSKTKKAVPVKATNIEDLRAKAQQLREQLEEIDHQIKMSDQFNLSSVYKDNLVYGVIYHEHNGNFEAYDVMSNQPTYLEEFARGKAIEYKDYLPVYIASFKPHKIVRRFEA
jgi:hypothetical protein